jgi:hypothetical protein
MLLQRERWSWASYVMGSGCFVFSMGRWIGSLRGISADISSSHFFLEMAGRFLGSGSLQLFLIQKIIQAIFMLAVEYRI